MCYHVATPTIQELDLFIKDIEALTIEPYESYYHTSGFAHKPIPVMTMGEPHKVQPYIWGYIPTWTKKLEDLKLPQNQPLNATCENSFITPMFRSAAPKQRCLIFVNGFYEWRWEDEKGKVKTPYFIYMPNHEPFAMGGLYNHWRGPDGEVYKTCAIMTAPANPLMERIHNNKKRMPLILDKDKWGAWLSPEVAQDEIQGIMKPYPDILQAHTISKNITKRGFDTNVPEIQEAVTPEGLF